MSADLGLAAGARPVLGSLTQEGRNRDRRFFTGMAIAAALTVFIGFAPSYYLSSAFDGRPLTTLVHVHGAIATAWILLFLTQTSLIAAKRTDLHRRLGAAGGVLAVLLLVVGYLTAVEGARRGATPPGGPPPLAFLAVPIGTLVVFATLVIAGLSQRRRSETHKRLMLLATISILTPAIARLRYIWGPGPVFPIVGTCLFVLACLVYDRLAHGRVHPAFLWGGILVMVTLPARFALGQTDAWLAVARWMTE
jgi:CHASE2 domain-containing sensor protein